jgi:type IV secretory pathway TrbL component
VEAVIVVGAVLVLFFVVSWVFRLVSNTLRTALFVAFILLVLWAVFGIGPEALWQQIQRWLPGAR